MAKATKTLKLTAKLQRSEHASGWFFLRFTAKEVASLKFESKRSRRVVCTLNDSHTFQCALLPWTEGGFCIVVNKQIRSKLGLSDGDKIRVELIPDESRYGLPMPKEFKEVLRQDREGDKAFHALTPGKQRTIIYYVGKWKDVDRRIHYALVVIEHLKKNEGKVIFPQLAEELKRPQFGI
jgi:hypothetical protein